MQLCTWTCIHQNKLSLEYEFITDSQKKTLKVALMMLENSFPDFTFKFKIYF